jgi:hypothetical protein
VIDTSTPWIKASASAGAGQCVEMRRRTDGGIDLRDSKDPEGTVLHYTPGEFAAWLDGAKKGEFDHLV